MARVVGVRFRTGGKIYYFSPGELSLETGNSVVVETARGLELGIVVVGPREVDEAEVVSPLKSVIRQATPEDLEQGEGNSQKEKEAFAVGVDKIAVHRLPMKLIDVEYTFDCSKIVFYFTAASRVDFRELVKDLAAVFKTRIELRQIGVRDEAKIVGGIGPCGRVLCCKAFLGEFEPVSIRMAKEQNLSLNPSKISGLCGRLMCCLRYECVAYASARAELPAVNTRVHTPRGSGVVIAVKLMRDRVTVRIDQDGTPQEFSRQEVVVENTKGEGGEKAGSE